MGSTLGKLGTKIGYFYRELLRRKTLRALFVYGAVALGVVEGTDIVLGVFDAPPGWILPTVMVVFIVGLPFAMVASWYFDVTPPGMERTPDASPDGQPALPSESQEAEEPEVKPAVSVEMGGAHRRQVTLLSCSFSPDQAADPEVLLSILPELEQLVDRVADRFGGFRIAGSATAFDLLFGYPTAHEDDSVRAVAAGLAIVDEARGIRLDDGERLVASVAVHNDLAVVEGSETVPMRVVGPAQRMVAWLQTLTPPDSVILDDNTFKLLRNRFHCEPLGMQANAQMGVSTALYRARELAAPRMADDEVKPLLGRESEVALIMERWERAVDGEDQFVVLRGEPGIGKSALIREVVRRAGQAGSTLVMPMFCSPFDSSRAFHPIVQYLLGPGLGLGPKVSDDEKVSRLHGLLMEAGLDVDRTGPLMASLLSVGDGADVSESSESARAELLGCLLDVFKAWARKGPLLLIFEDLHWADPSTLEVIEMLVGQGSNAGVLCIFTTRPTLKLEWESRSNVTTLDLQRLSKRATEALVTNILETDELPAGYVERIVSETGGNPLFAEELAKSVVEAVDRDPNGSISNVVLPSSLQQSLVSRIDNLGPAKSLLQLCSLLGREFDYKLLKAVSKTENEEALQQELHAIVNAEFLYQQGVVPESSYVFKHILIQETAYQSLLVATRKALHGHVAEILETEFAETASRAPERLAFHCEESGQPAKAVAYWSAACQRALEAYALREAIELAHNGLRALQNLPESVERDRAEIALTSMLGKGLLATRGYADPEVEKTFARALELCERIGDEPQLFQLVVGLWMYFQIGGEAAHAWALAERLVRLAQGSSSAAKTLQARYCSGYTLYRLGRYAESRDQLELALAAEEDGVDFTTESPSGDDTRIHVRCALAHVFWHLGYFSRAEDLMTEALELASALGNPYGVIWARFQMAWLYQLLEQPQESYRFSDETVELAKEKGFRFFLALGSFMKAWASGDAGRALEGEAAAARIQGMEAGLAGYQMVGARMGFTSINLSIAEDLIGSGKLEEAKARLEAIRSEIDAMGERYFAPDVVRLEGRLAQAGGDQAAAEEFFARAQQQARDAGSVGLALRAARDLANLHAENGDDELARALLADAEREALQAVEQAAG